MPARPATAPVVLAPKDKPAARGWKKPAGWTTVGVGGASLVVGIVCGAMASRKSNEHDSARDGGGVYDDLNEIQRTGERYESAQVALMMAGGVLAAVGGGLLIWEQLGRKEEPAQSRAMFTPVVLDHGVGFAGSLRF